MRLIDADDLKKTWYKEHNIEPGESGAMFVGNNEVPKFIDRARTIDAVQVIRCRDCRWWDKEREQCGITPSSSPYGHCHDGEILEHSMIKDAGR